MLKDLVMPGPPKDIDDYLRSVTPQQRAALQALRQQISSLVPGAEECISYSMPAFRVPGGHVIAGFLATKKGCSYFPFSGTTLDSMAAELTSYSRTKSGLHFDPARGIPKTLLRKLIATRRAELAAYPASKSSKKRSESKAGPKRAKAKRRPPGARAAADSKTPPGAAGSTKRRATSRR